MPGWSRAAGRRWLEWIVREQSRGTRQPGAGHRWCGSRQTHPAAPRMLPGTPYPRARSGCNRRRCCPGPKAALRDHWPDARAVPESRARTDGRPWGRQRGAGAARCTPGARAVLRHPLQKLPSSLRVREEVGPRWPPAQDGSRNRGVARDVQSHRSRLSIQPIGQVWLSTKLPMGFPPRSASPSPAPAASLPKQRRRAWKGA